jgi:acyl-CoA hydrolase
MHYSYKPILPQTFMPNNKQPIEGKKVSESKTVMTEMVMPNDTNPLGNLMGGNLMHWMDVVAAICAGRHCETYVVTASVDHVSFTRPINNGDVVTLEASVTRAFSTSVEIFVEVFTSNIKGKHSQRSNHAYFTFVGIDEERNPCPIPAVLPLSEEEQKRYESAARRRELRLVLSGRMKPEDATDIRALFEGIGKKNSQ